MSDDLVERVAGVFSHLDHLNYEYGKRHTWNDYARAAIALALEEAAKVADDEACHCEDTGSAPSDFGNAGRNDAARTIAAAIRALTSKEPK